MTKAWCMWCEMGDQYPPMYKRNGMVWIHESCFLEITDLKGEIKHIRALLDGKEPGPKGDTIESFLERTEDFKKRWNKSMELIERLKKSEQKESDTG